MKNIIIFIGVLFLFGCKKNDEIKQEPILKVPQYCNWTLTVTGSDTTIFSVVFFSSVTPYIFVPYQAKCEVSPIIIKMIVGQVYGVQYRDTDSIVKYINYNPIDTISVNDTIPGTIL